jgi:proteasome accessory factor C
VDADGRRQVSVRVADPAWVRALALGAAGHVEVLSPEWLAESVREEARAALAAYSA